MDTIMVTLRTVHVIFAVLWVGTAAFIVLYLQPGLRPLGPEVQRSVLLQVGPRSAMGIEISMTMVYITGLIMVWRHLGFGRLGELFTTSWGLSILLGFLAATGMAIFAMTLVIGSIYRLKAMAQAGTLPTPEEARRLQWRMRRGAIGALVFGVMALTAMMVARGYD